MLNSIQKPQEYNNNIEIEEMLLAEDLQAKRQALMRVLVNFTQIVCCNSRSNRLLSKMAYAYGTRI
jgi:hypothetical protein